MEHCEQLFELGKLSNCFDELVEVLEQDQPPLRAYYLMSRLLHNHPRVNMALIRKALTHQHNDQELLSQLKLTLAATLIDCNQLEQAREVLLQPNPNQSYLWMAGTMVDVINDSLDKRNKPLDKQQQVQQYQLLTEEEDRLQLLNQEGFFAYLIPTRWLQRWKKYVGMEGNEIETEEPHQFNMGRLRQLVGEESTSDTTYPGPIDGYNLIQFNQDLVVDGFPPRTYQNYVVSNDLTEGRDFYFVGHRVFRFFREYYGAFEVKRQVVMNQHQRRTYVDVTQNTIPQQITAKLINFIAFPKHTKQQSTKQQSVLVGSKYTFDLVTQKLNQITNNTNQCRWWKLNTPDDQEQFIQQLRRKDHQELIINGKLIEDRVSIEELNISQSDTLILEYRVGDKWALSVKKQHQPNIQQYYSSKSNQSIQKLIHDYDISHPAKLNRDSRQGLTGLQNLGNTCFMNSALQCLSNVYELTQFMVSNGFVQDLNPKNPIGTKGFLATTYAELMKQVWFGKSSSVSAWELKRVIGKFAPQFYGYGQQDSQELLSYVLDGMHEDLNRVVNKPTTEDIEITNEPDSEAASTFWNNYQKRNDSIIADLVAGQFKSTLVCPNCSRVSKTFDPYLSISLPIPNYTTLNLSLYYVAADSNSIPLKIQLPLSSDQSTQDILNKLSQIVGCDQYQLEPCLIRDHRINERVKPTSTAKSINEHDGILFVYQLERRDRQLQNDEALVEVYYKQKSKKLLEFEDKILSYVRQLVIARSQCLADLYRRVYLLFRTHFLICIKQLGEQEFPKDLLNQFNEESQVDLDTEIQLLQERNKLPFVLRYQDALGKNKSKEFTTQDQIPLHSQSQYLKVDLFVADYLKQDLLKLQRCKQHPVPEQDAQVPKKRGDYNIQDCLRMFTRSEVLGEDDKWYCNRCKSHVRASKTMEIYKAPQILILHLKRFKTNRIHNLGSYYFSGGSQKISSLVTFPLESFNLNEYVLSKRSGDPIDYTYDLFAVSNHFGGMGGGHYTAFAQSPITQGWYDYNDSSVRQTNKNEIVSEAAYLLFYRRRGAKPCELQNFR